MKYIEIKGEGALYGIALYTVVIVQEMSNLIRRIRIKILNGTLYKFQISLGKAN